MIVEFVGLPGVGKSYLCRSLEDVYAARVSTPVRVLVERDTAGLGALRRQLEKLWRAARFAAAHPGTTGRLARAVGPVGRMIHRGRLSKLVNLLAEVHRSSRGSRSTTWISEQGVLQAVWSLEMRCDDSVHTALIETLAPWLPDRVVFVASERPEHESRLRGRERGRSHFDRLAVDRLPEAIERGSRHAREILETWTRHVPRADRLDFRNDGPVRGDDIVDWVDGRRGGTTTSDSRRNETIPAGASTAARSHGTTARAGGADAGSPARATRR